MKGLKAQERFKNLLDKQEKEYQSALK
jgi:hypothetical protein